MVTAYTLILHHNGGGGIAQSMRATPGPMLSCYKRGSRYIFTNQDGKKEYLPTIKHVIRKTKQFAIKDIVIRHLWNIPFQDCLSLIRHVKRPLTIYLHDFFAICPRLFFVDRSGTYCQIPADAAICNTCIHPDKMKQMKAMLNEGTPSITTWRHTFHSLLKQASRIIAPSDTVKQIYVSFFPDLSIEVVPNTVMIQRYLTPKITPHLPLRVALLGNLFRHKGEKPIKELLTRLSVQPLPLQLYSYGQVARAFRSSSMLIQRGAYKQTDLEQHLLSDKIDIVCIPSICPEAFSHTTHEATTLGYPVVCFHLGAQAETVLKNKAGWVVNEHNGQGLYQQFEHLCHSLNDIRRVKQRLLHFPEL